MYVRCSWHGKFIGEKEPYDDTSVTDGICDDCRRKYFHEYVEREEVPLCNDMMP